MEPGERLYLVYRVCFLLYTYIVLERQRDVRKTLRIGPLKTYSTALSLILKVTQTQDWQFYQCNKVNLVSMKVL